MCVIVHKPRGIDSPSKEILEKCFTRNPNGAGVLLHRAGTKTLEIHKGFMTFADFEKAFNDLKIKKDDDCIFHFRITTSGGTSAANCHPFPITSNVDELKATRLNITRAFVHNGILGKGDDTLKISDTQIFVKDVMSRKEICENLEDSEVQKIISEMASTANRFFVADSEKDIFQRFGKWSEDKGLYFSNTHWKYDYSSYGNYSGSYSGRGYSTGSYSNHKPLPDINTILCPCCDREMVIMLKGQPFYFCPDCGTVYNDDNFEIYLRQYHTWESLVDLNNFTTDLDELLK